METEINEVKEPTTEINEKLTKEELIERFAAINGISCEKARDLLQIDNTSSPEQVLSNIEKYTLNKINSKRVPMNRAQRRALKKKVGAKKYAEMCAESGDITTVVSETAAKLNYIDLIQKLRKLNEENEKNGKTTIEDD